MAFMGWGSSALVGGFGRAGGRGRQGEGQEALLFLEKKKQKTLSMLAVGARAFSWGRDFWGGGGRSRQSVAAGEIVPGRGIVACGARKGGRTVSSTQAWMKVFWFFFSKKNALALPIG
jgi:hypothetical protein